MFDALFLGLTSLLVATAMPSPAGIVRTKSSRGVAETVERLEASIRQKGLTIFSRVDHAAGAKTVDMSLRPTTVLLFGSAKGGTPLMQSQQEVGLDLPLKVLVWEDASGETWLSYTDPVWLAERYAIKDREDAVEGIAALLRALVNAAAS
jgi:uncharacterized protein (DUF302 family)